MEHSRGPPRKWLHVVQLPVTWSRAYRKADKSLSLSFVTNEEVPTPEFAAIDAVVPATGFLLFAANRFTDADIPQDDAPSDNKKPSQRLRAVLDRCWEQTDKTEDFEAYYRRRMERVIEHFKQELD